MFYAFAAMQSPPEATPAGFPLIDGFKFAETAGELRGRCKVAGFSRLQDVLSSNAGELDYEVTGAADEAGRPALHVKVAGPLQLTCQRCLKPLAFDLEVGETLVLARSEAEIEAQPVEPEAPDRILASKEMAVGTLLEDEILLAVPIAPRHEHCEPAGAEKYEAQASPFAGLRGLLDQGGRARN